MVGLFFLFHLYDKGLIFKKINFLFLLDYMRFFNITLQKYKPLFLIIFRKAFHLIFFIIKKSFWISLNTKVHKSISTAKKVGTWIQLMDDHIFKCINNFVKTLSPKSIRGEYAHHFSYIPFVFMPPCPWLIANDLSHFFFGVPWILVLLSFVKRILVLIITR